MSSHTPPSPKTPPRKNLSWRHHGSPSHIDSPGCCSTPSTSKKLNGLSPGRKILWEKRSPSKHTKLLGSPITKHPCSPQDSKSFKSFQSTSKDTDASDLSCSLSKHVNSTDPSWSKSFSSAESNGTVTVELDFPHGGWDEDSSNEDSPGSLEIVESDAESHASPNQRGRKRKQSEVSEEDNAILSGMGEEIERQLEAKAERNRLTVPNVKNILRSVITNPYVQAMVRRSIKSGDVAVSGDSDDLSFEPRLTRAKARLLCDSNESSYSEVQWVGTPHKTPSGSECQALINEEMNDDSEDDEEYHPGEDEPSDNDCSERDGSERDISLDQQSPANFDLDTDSCPATPNPSPKPLITDSATQTNWSEDGVFKVPMAPSELQLDQNTEENIALRTRSKLPLNDTPLEEIEQAFIPPDITPDLYDTTCDNADWQEFLKEFMQPMRSEVQNPDDDEEDPEYNVLAEEEIIDKEELRRDRAVKVSKRELNELMRELLEFTENFSSEDEDKDKDGDKKQTAKPASPRALSPRLSTSPNGSNEDMSILLDAYMSLGTLAPLKTTPPPPRSPSNTSLHTPVPPMSPPCSRTPNTGKKGHHNDLSFNVDSTSLSSSGYHSGGKGKSVYQSPGKKKNFPQTPGKPDNYPHSSGSRSGKKERTGFTPGKPDSFTPKKSHVLATPGKLDNHPSYSNKSSGELKGNLSHSRGKLDSYLNAINDNHGNSSETFFYNDDPNVGMVGNNVAVPVTSNQYGGNTDVLFSPGKNYLVLNSSTDWDKPGETIGNSSHLSAEEIQSSDDNTWSNSVVGINTCETLSAQANEEEQKEPSSVEEDDPELSVSLPASSPPHSPVPGVTSWNVYNGEAHLSAQGDVLVNNTVVLSFAQRHVLDQQMRQYVQLMTQHFLQTYEHPVYNDYSSICKKQLVSLDTMAAEKRKSAFRSANLTPALELVDRWEKMIQSEEGTAITGFVEQEMARAKRVKNRKNRYCERFSPQLMKEIVDSPAFIYPELLPHMPFRTVEMQKVMMVLSEEHLLAIGLEEFTEFIAENNPSKKDKCLRWAMSLVTEYLLIGKNPKNLYDYLRKMKRRNSPLSHFLETKCAPETQHFIKPFNEQHMLSIRERPNCVLPLIWRDFIHPALDTLKTRKNKSGD
ncbi:uncharacterized protein LOC117648120 [Thrips palmi]|uniref:Uncharacterized protein LOC117648120 n=1 Tax=Thrips palmi TaxID=161013 RepID=A0A6P8ZQQ2_THRPL|nr:uncharacterized protein LOC117648120 [Thrips palmi]XP_034246250.1 uncharacterized protein LOC117648120 [Thrips palmi]